MTYSYLREYNYKQYIAAILIYEIHKFTCIKIERCISGDMCFDVNPY